MFDAYFRDARALKVVPAASGAPEVQKPDTRYKLMELQAVSEFAGPPGASQGKLRWAKTRPQKRINNKNKNQTLISASRATLQRTNRPSRTLPRDPTFCLWPKLLWFWARPDAQQVPGSLQKAVSKTVWPVCKTIAAVS